jgi:hypothetical protein
MTFSVRTMLDESVHSLPCSLAALKPIEKEIGWRRRMADVLGSLDAPKKGFNLLVLIHNVNWTRSDPPHKHYLLHHPPFDLTDLLETRQQLL